MSDRDRTIEALLRSRTGEHDAPLTDQCLDAESIAAWMDDGLSPDMRRALESHAAGCARCQALFASMARTAPEGDVRAWWSAGAKWLVPVAAAATALVVWLLVAPSRQASAPPQTFASATKAVEPSSSPQADAPPQSSAAPVAGPIDKRLGSTDEQKTEPRRRELDRDDRAAQNQRVAAAEATLPRVASVPPQPQALADSLTRSAALPPAPPPPAAPAPAAAAPSQGQSAASQPTFVAPQQPNAEPPIGVSKRLAVSEQAAAEAPRASVASTEIRSPDPNYRWRIVPPGTLQRSTDGGMTWAAVDLPSSATARNIATSVLTTGSSPAPDVCWIVGRSGTVLLSTNGTTWQRRPFPEAVDLAAVRGLDATRASVTTIDGRRFVTFDGGATWTNVK